VSFSQAVHLFGSFHICKWCGATSGGADAVAGAELALLEYKVLALKLPLPCGQMWGRSIVTSLRRWQGNSQQPHLHLCSVTQDLILFLYSFVLCDLFSLLFAHQLQHRDECKAQWLSQSPRRSRSPRSVGSSTERTSCAPLSQPLHTGVCVFHSLISNLYVLNDPLLRIKQANIMPSTRS
jgi:hypothetical protein